MPCFENVIVKNDPFKYICPCKFEEKKPAVTGLKYWWYGVKFYPINQSIEK